MDGRTRKCGRKCGDRRDVPCFFLHTSNPQKTCRAGNVGTDGTFPSFCDQNGCLVSEIGERPVCPQVFRFPRFSRNQKTLLALYGFLCCLNNYF